MLLFWTMETSVMQLLPGRLGGSNASLSAPRIVQSLGRAYTDPSPPLQPARLLEAPWAHPTYIQKVQIKVEICAHSKSYALRE